MDALLKSIGNILRDSGYARLFTLGSEGNIFERIASGGVGNLIMLAVACFLIYLAVKKQFEPCCSCRLRSACCWSTYP